VARPLARREGQEARPLYVFAVRRRQAFLHRRRLSQVENVLALSILLRRFHPEYVGPEPPGINATVTLTPKGGLPFKIRELS